VVKPVVVVGAGLAGLVCARKLHQSGISVIVVDAADRPGGRLKTDRIGGFQLDHGFQVFFTAYPNARRALDYDALKFGKFAKGTYIFHDEGLHLLESQSILEMMRNRFALARDKTIPNSDKKLLGSFAESAGMMSQRQAFSTTPKTTLELLEDHGFGDEIIDRFFRPFLAGMFLDPELKFDSRQFLFIWGMLNQGDTVLPAEGMEAIAKQIAADIPRYLYRFGNPVSEVLRDDHGHACGVRFDTTEEIQASHVVLATDAHVAGRLAGQPTVEGGKSSCTLYFETPTPLVDGAYLVLNGSGDGLVNHVAPLSSACPSYAPSGKHIASATILGDPSQTDEELAEIAKAEIGEWAPTKGANMWRFIKAYRSSYAQMVQAVGFAEKLPNNSTATNGLYWAGEFTENSSIDGAIRSGMECAALLMSEREATEAA